MRPFNVVVTTITLLMLITTATYAGERSTKTITTKYAGTSQAYCMGLVMANEARPNVRGWVSVTHALMVRGTSGEYGAVGNFCAAARARGQFTALVKKPTAAMLKVANQMYADWKNGKPTIEVALQRQLDRCAYFHNDTVRPGWSYRYKSCGFVEGHFMYRHEGDPSPYRQLASN